MSGRDRVFRRRHEGHVSHERWLITYADLITLLLVFFVVMYSMSMADVRKFQNLAGSLNRAFNVGVLQGQSSTSLTDQGMLATSGESMEEDPNGALELPLPVVPVPELASLRGLASSQPGIDVYDRSEGVAISLSGSTLFVSGSAELRREGMQVLDRVAAELINTSGDIRVEGHTDNVPTGSSTYATNWELSAARSLAVVQRLQAAGIAPERLIAAGFGEHRPVASNDTPEGRARNRRAEIVLIPQGAPGGATSGQAHAAQGRTVLP